MADDKKINVEDTEEVKENTAAEEETAGTSEQETKEQTEAENESGAEAESAADAGQEAEAEPEEKEEAGKDAPKEAEEGKKKKGIFGKKKEKTDKKDEMIADLKDKLTRQMAEFDNYRKRTEKEKAANFIIGAKEVLEKILPVVDNFERGLADADSADPFAEGMNMIYKQLIGVLSDMGVSHIEAVGKPFDPELHNAVMHVEDENEGENIVVEEFQKGYMYKDQVLRHSMVKVAN